MASIRYAQSADDLLQAFRRPREITPPPPPGERPPSVPPPDAPEWRRPWSPPPSPLPLPSGRGGAPTSGGAPPPLPSGYLHPFDAAKWADPSKGTSHKYVGGRFLVGGGSLDDMLKLPMFAGWTKLSADKVRAPDGSVFDTYLGYSETGTKRVVWNRQGGTGPGGPAPRVPMPSPWTPRPPTPPTQAPSAGSAADFLRTFQTMAGQPPQSLGGPIVPPLSVGTPGAFGESTPAAPAGAPLEFAAGDAVRRGMPPPPAPGGGPLPRAPGPSHRPYTREEYDRLTPAQRRAWSAGATREEVDAMGRPPVAPPPDPSGTFTPPPSGAAWGSGYRPQFSDPATAQLERYLMTLLAEMEAQWKAQGVNNKDLRKQMAEAKSSVERLVLYLRERAGELQKPAYTGAEGEIMRTQALEPIERDRTAANKRALENIGSRGFLPTSGIAQSLIGDVNRGFDVSRAQAQGDLAYRQVAEKRSREQEAQALLSQIPQVQMGSASQQLTFLQQLDAALNATRQQGLGYSRELYGLPLTAMEDAIRAMGMQTGGSADAGSLISQLMQMYQQQYGQSAAGRAQWMQLMGQLLPYITGGR